MTGERDGTAVRRDRFSGGPARAFLSSMSVDERIFASDLAVDRAHVVMLAEQDIIEPDTAREILAALETIEAEGFDALPDAEDVHEAIETRVIDLVGPAGGAMHTARSRNDEVAACLRHRLRDDLLELVEAVLALRDALAGVAEAHRETVMPGYTHLQPAQPITVAHWACSYERTIARDSARLIEAFDRTNQSPLGAAAFAGTPFPVDRERTGELLGFDGVVLNAMDAAASRDFAVETLGAVAVLAGTLSGLAEDVVLFAHRGFLALDDDYASTSSIMPQKKNPDSFELVRATAGDAVGAFQGIHSTLKGLPRAYNRDLQRATPHIWRSMDAVTEATRVGAGGIETAEWDQAAMSSAAGEGFSTATGVADLLAMGGLPFRKAHEVVARAAERDGEDPLADLERAAEDLLEADLTAYVDADDLDRALDIHGSVASRDSLGGPAPAAIDAQLETIRAASETDIAELEARQNQLAEAQATLDREVNRRA